MHYGEAAVGLMHTNFPLFQTSSVDVNECEEDNVCSDGLTCINVEGTYECRCEEGNPQCSAGRDAKVYTFPRKNMNLIFLLVNF